MTVGSGTRGQPVAVPDPLGIAPGRGAHLHPTAACYELAVRKKAFGRALRVPTGVDGAAVGEYVAGLASEPTDDREEGWSSSS